MVYMQSLATWYVLTDETHTFLELVQCVVLFLGDSVFRVAYAAKLAFLELALAIALFFAYTPFVVAYRATRLP